MKALLPLAGSLLTAPALAQTGFSIGAEVAAATDRVVVEDPGGRLVEPELPSVYVGVAGRYRFHKYGFAELGVAVKRYDIGIAFSELSGTSTGTVSVQVPLRLGGRIALLRNRLSIEPFIGHSLVWQRQVEGYRTSAVDYPVGNDAITFTAITNYPVSIYSLLEAGLNLDYRLGRSVHVGLRGHLFRGFGKPMVDDIRYSVNGGAEVIARQYGQGSFSAIGVGIRVDLVTTALK
ncbi:hypothetical protein [Flaviaesturariibacter amylovorans]|uniref:Outer membrane protein beta-barrel domain-containing protein n=1 Tax=Flaviaesturariibacter amylovorans TaxID=1084520 RepID=A0ABP8GW26_9BACT